MSRVTHSTHDLFSLLCFLALQFHCTGQRGQRPPSRLSGAARIAAAVADTNVMLCNEMLSYFYLLVVLPLNVHFYSCSFLFSSLASAYQGGACLSLFSLLPSLCSLPSSLLETEPFLHHPAPPGTEPLHPSSRDLFSLLSALFSPLFSLPSLFS